MKEPIDPPTPSQHEGRSRREGWGAALLMAAAPFLLMALLVLADRLLSR